jgi:hypothetical protein
MVVAPLLVAAQTFDTQSSRASLSKRVLRGGIDTGGGTMVRLNDGTYSLLDIANFAPDLNRISPVGVQLPLFQNPIKGLFVSAAEKRFGKSLSLKNIGLDRDYQELVEKWRESSPLFVKVVLGSSNVTTAYYHFVDIGFTGADANAYIRSSLDPSSLSLVAVYTLKPDIQTAFSNFLTISRPQFNKLNRIGQLGLFVHEVLRARQLYDRYDFSDQELQKLTVRILKGPVTKNDSLDDYALADWMKADHLQFEQSRLNIKSLVAETCVYFKNSTELCNDRGAVASAATASELSSIVISHLTEFSALVTESVEQDRYWEMAELLRQIIAELDKIELL